MVALARIGLTPADVLAELRGAKACRGWKNLRPARPRQREGGRHERRDRRGPHEGRAATLAATVGHISYGLHTVVAVAAVLPGCPGQRACCWWPSSSTGEALDARRHLAGVAFLLAHPHVVWAGGLYMVTAPLWILLFVPGWIAWTLISVWFLYRVVRGWLAV
jgi:hypothetical protein